MAVNVFYILKRLTFFFASFQKDHDNTSFLQLLIHNKDDDSYDIDDEFLRLQH